MPTATLMNRLRQITLIYYEGCPFSEGDDVTGPLTDDNGTKHGFLGNAEVRKISKQSDLAKKPHLTFTVLVDHWLS
jgi:hypothetical protein